MKMSIMYEKCNICLVDHNSYISKVYSNIYERKNLSYRMKMTYFSLKNYIRESSPRNRKRKGFKTDQDIDEAIKIKSKFIEFIETVPEHIKTEISSKCIAESSTVREEAQKTFENTNFELKLEGRNESDCAFVTKISNEDFLMCPLSRFYSGCVKEQCLKLDGEKFDLLIADPPWWNKYIRRLKAANETLSYSMMYNEDIASIPVKNLLSDNCLIAVWCTNSISNIKAVKNLIFPSWGVEYIATWYWLKITTDLKPICDFGTGCQKQPFERILIGKVGNIPDVCDERVLISVPSVLHSHKPPLLDLLKPYLKKDFKTLELFARYLLPNTTSVGYEPLKWQHSSLYESY